MRQRARAIQGRVGAINATPLIDVVMCMIVFYLIVGNLASGQLAEVDLPEARAGDDPAEPEPLIVNVLVREPGIPGWPDLPVRVEVEGRDVADPRALETLIRGRLLDRPETTLQVRASRRLAYGDVEPVLRACARAGARTVGLGAERAP